MIQIRSALADDTDFLGWVILTAARGHRERGWFDVVLQQDEAFCVEYCRPGVKFVMSWTVLIPTRSRFSDVKAEMATGTSCRLCSRFSAVTTSSSMVLVLVAAVWA